MERVEYSESGSREKRGGGGFFLSLSLLFFFKERCVSLCFYCKSGDTRFLKGFWDWIKDVLHGKEKGLKVIERNDCERKSLESLFYLCFIRQICIDQYHLVFVYNIKEFIVIIIHVRFFPKIHASFIFIKILQIVEYIIMICTFFAFIMLYLLYLNFL